MINLFKILVITILCLVTYSCKKQNETPPATTQTNNTATMASPYVPTAAYGFLSTKKTNIYLVNAFFSADTEAFAKFYKVPVFSGDSSSFKYSGTVKFNGDSLWANPFYNNILFKITSSLSNCNWSVSGNSVTPAFTHSYSINHPTFTGNNQLPDSFSISNPLTLNFGLALNYNISRVIFEDGSTYIDKKFTAGNPTFSTTDLINLTSLTTCNIHVLFGNYHDINVSGKNYRFITTLEHIKASVKVKP